jgi:hypothetical protein
MPTACSPALFDFAPVEGRHVVAGFDGGAIISNAGAVLRGATDRAHQPRFALRHLLAARLRQSNIDASAGAVEEVARIIGQSRARRPRVRILLRADSSFAREALMACCEANRVVTSLCPAEIDARTLGERVCCARGAMENRIKECRLDLFAGRASAASLRANATCGALRRALLRIGAQVRRSVRRVTIAMASGHPFQNAFGLAHARITAAAS